MTWKVTNTYIYQNYIITKYDQAQEIIHYHQLKHRLRDIRLQATTHASPGYLEDLSVIFVTFFSDDAGNEFKKIFPFDSLQKQAVENQIYNQPQIAFRLHYNNIAECKLFMALLYKFGDLSDEIINTASRYYNIDFSASKELAEHIVDKFSAKMLYLKLYREELQKLGLDDATIFDKLYEKSTYYELGQLFQKENMLETALNCYQQVLPQHPHYREVQLTIFYLICDIQGTTSKTTLSGQALEKFNTLNREKVVALINADHPDEQRNALLHLAEISGDWTNPPIDSIQSKGETSVALAEQLKIERDKNNLLLEENKKLKQELTYSEGLRKTLIKNQGNFESKPTIASTCSRKYL